LLRTTRIQRQWELKEDEKDISTQQYLAQEDPRFSRPDVHQERPPGYQEKTRQGAEAVGGHHRQQIGHAVPAHEFPKSERLLKRHEFLRLSGQGRKIHSPSFIVLLWDSGRPAARIGITASRKTGNAVVRNRIKRMVREFYRLHKALFAAADYNVIAKPGAARLSSPELVRELSGLLQRLR
jgi:ribonuclease P protein component